MLYSISQLPYFRPNSPGSQPWEGSPGSRAQPGFPTHLRVGGGHCGARSVCRWGWLPSKRRDSRFFSFSESLSLPSFLSHLSPCLESASTASSSSSPLLNHCGLALCTGRSPPLNTGFSRMPSWAEPPAASSSWRAGIHPPEISRRCHRETFHNQPPYG